MENRDWAIGYDRLIKGSNVDLLKRSTPVHPSTNFVNQVALVHIDLSSLVALLHLIGNCTPSLPTRTQVIVS